MGRGPIHIYTHIQTFRLLDRIGPVGRFGENWKCLTRKITIRSYISNIRNCVKYISTHFILQNPLAHKNKKGQVAKHIQPGTTNLVKPRTKAAPSHPHPLQLLPFLICFDACLKHFSSTPSPPTNETDSPFTRHFSGRQSQDSNSRPRVNNSTQCSRKDTGEARAVHPSAVGGNRQVQWVVRDSALFPCSKTLDRGTGAFSRKGTG